MTGRERLLAAFDGSTPDRPPCTLAIYPIDMERMAARGRAIVDVQFLRLEPSAEDEQLRARAYAHPADTRLGSAVQEATYARWSYRPERSHGRNPLAAATTLEELESFPFPRATEARRIDALREEVTALHSRGVAVGCGLPHLGGELLEAGWRLRGLEAFLLDLLERHTLAAWLLDRLTELACRNAEAVARAGFDVLLLGDDVGMPASMIIGPDLWRQHFRPRLERMIAAARAASPSIRVLYHSDGWIEPILGGLLEIGVNAINPVQPDQMDPTGVRRRFGDRLVLWGTVGSQSSFSRWIPEDIRREVRERALSLGPRALVLCPAYDIDEPDTRETNLNAFLDAVADLG